MPISQYNRLLGQFFPEYSSQKSRHTKLPDIQGLERKLNPAPYLYISIEGGGGFSFVCDHQTTVPG